MACIVHYLPLRTGFSIMATLFPFVEAIAILLSSVEWALAYGDVLVLTSSALTSAHRAMSWPCSLIYGRQLPFSHAKDWHPLTRSG